MISASQYGGGVYVYSDGVANFEGCNIHDNTAGSRYGGGLYIQGTATLINTNVYSNQASGGAAVYNLGTMTAIDCTFVSRPKSTVYLTTTATAHVSNCTFTKDTSTARHDNFIYTSGVYVDYGNCTPGRNPGLSGANILVDDGGFTGCPVACPLGMWGRGGPTATLQELKTG